jgi:hypothetical protein
MSIISVFSSRRYSSEIIQTTAYTILALEKRSLMKILGGFVSSVRLTMRYVNDFGGSSTSVVSVTAHWSGFDFDRNS